MCIYKVGIVNWFRNWFLNLIYDLRNKENCNSIDFFFLKDVEVF